MDPIMQRGSAFMNANLARRGPECKRYLASGRTVCSMAPKGLASA